MNKITAKEIKSLKKPKPTSHKGDNGLLLIIAGSKQYHGSLLLAATIASKIVDLVYILSDKENQEVIKKMKPKLFEFIAIRKKELLKFAKKVDCILLGPGLGISQAARRLTNFLLKKFPTKKFVLDADSLKVLNKKLLGPNCIVTPHAGEFKILFKEKATPENVQKFSRQYHCTIVLKGPTDYVCDNGQCKYNVTGNQGMTKGGTGDVLAGLIAALACKNNLFLSACAGTFLNGLAGDRLKKKVSYYYSASDLISEIPKARMWCEQS